MLPARPPNSSLEITKSVGIHVSVSCWKKVVPLHLHWTYNIYIYYNLKGGPKINQSTAHFQLELPSQTVSPQRVALQKVSPTLPEAWSHWMAFVQLQHPNCPPFSSSKKMQKMQVLKKKTEKWSHSKFTKKFQHHFSLQLDFGHYSLKPKDVGVRRHGEGLWAGHCGVAVEADGTGARSKLASTFAERRRGWPW